MAMVATMGMAMATNMLHAMSSAISSERPTARKSASRN